MDFMSIVNFVLIVTGSVIAVILLIFVIGTAIKRIEKINIKRPDKDPVSSGIEDIVSSKIARKIEKTVVEGSKEDARDGIVRSRDLTEIEKNLEQARRIIDQSMEEGERALRDAIMRRLREHPKFFYEDGRRKMLLPLEAIAFLNKNLNPLVTEHGEIVVEVKEEPIIEDIKKIIIDLKNSDEILYKPDEELIEFVKEIILIMKERNIGVKEAKDLLLQQNASARTDKDNQKKEETEIGKSEVEEKASTGATAPEPANTEAAATEPAKETSEEEGVQDFSDLDISALEQDLLNFNPEDAGAGIEDLGIEQIERDLEHLPPEVDQDIEIETSADSAQKQDGGNDQNSQESVYEVLSKMRWAEGEGLVFNAKEIDESIVANLSQKRNFTAFVNNIVKLKPIIMDDGKTAFFVDVKILAYAFAKMFGVDFEKIFNKILKMPQAVQRKMNSGLERALEPYIVEIDGKKGMSTFFFSKGKECFKGFGLWLDPVMFGEVLDPDMLDRYKSSTPNEGFHRGLKTSNCKKFVVQDYSNVEIKA